ncbi:MAG: hypothetical protein IPM98_08505 [Lewinellaceae bacterium]|nr:hypothetical protein [Lewinellaceae bacterium]
MSKKKFSEGLDDLFKDHPAEVDTWGHDAETAPRERRLASKNFMHDLDLMLQEAMDESFEKLESDRPTASSNKSKSAAAYRAPVSGLDALIRQTVDFQEMSTDEESGKKRLTVAVDRTKLEQLKAIARLENAYMKDILVQLIDEYIQEYAREKGI